MLPQPPDGKHLGLYTGTVVDRVDPKALGRVRIRVPGLLEPASAWAWPLGTLGGGSAGRGGWFVPELGAEVGVLFNQGDVDHPYYLAGNWGRPEGASEVPEPARDAATQAPDVRVIETKLWRIVLDDRPESPGLFLLGKATGDEIEFDGLAAAVRVKGTVALVLESTGVVSVTGMQVTIQGRVVRPGSDPI